MVTGSFDPELSHYDPDPGSWIHLHPKILISTLALILTLTLIHIQAKHVFLSFHFSTQVDLPRGEQGILCLNSSLSSLHMQGFSFLSFSKWNLHLKAFFAAIYFRYKFSLFAFFSPANSITKEPIS